jgi:mono/diheme cytochrome c family protein
VPRLPEPPPPPYRSEGVGSLGRGAEDFKQACAGCHGPDGQGIFRNGRLERRLNDPVFLALTSDQVLRRYIITGRPEPGIGMPDYAGKAGRPPAFRPLTSQQIADVVALLASWRQGGSPGNQ